MAAFAPDAGELVQDLGKDKPTPEWVKKLIVDPAGFLTPRLDVITKDFAHDVSAVTRSSSSPSKTARGRGVR